MLIVFGGLPGSGKTTLSQALAAERRAVYLRIDTIEQAIRDAEVLAGAVGPAGYIVGYGIAAANLQLGGEVIADCVNPVAITRDAWRRIAAEADAPIVEIEVICSDPAEHRQRVETRQVDVKNLVPPDWQAVMAHDYEPWRRERLSIDTAGRSIDDALAELRAAIAGR